MTDRIMVNISGSEPTAGVGGQNASQLPILLDSEDVGASLPVDEGFPMGLAADLILRLQAPNHWAVAGRYDGGYCGRGGRSDKDYYVCRQGFSFHPNCRTWNGRGWLWRGANALWHTCFPKDLSPSSYYATAVSDVRSSAGIYMPDLLPVPQEALPSRRRSPSGAITWQNAILWQCTNIPNPPCSRGRCEGGSFTFPSCGGPNLEHLAGLGSDQCCVTAANADCPPGKHLTMIPQGGNYYPICVGGSVPPERQECVQHNQKCGWTRDWHCPGQAVGKRRQTAGWDNTVGYRCCCFFHR